MLRLGPAQDCRRRNPARMLPRIGWKIWMTGLRDEHTG
jgi:hypothetical protein